MYNVDKQGLSSCPICGKRFVCYSKTWRYKKHDKACGYNFFCSYSCMQIYLKNKEKEK